jgi:hypothetical protein
LAGTGAAASLSLSLSSSASLSEPEEEEEEEEEEEDEEDEEAERLLDCFFGCAFGASFISTSESLDSSELLSLSELLLKLVELPEELPDFLVAFASSAWLAEFWKISSKDGTFLDDLLTDILACSLTKAALVLVNPNSVRKASIEAISWGGGEGALLAFWRREWSARTNTGVWLEFSYLFLILGQLCRRGFLSLLSSHDDLGVQCLPKTMMV